MVWMVFIGHRSSKSTFGANKLPFKIMLSRCVSLAEGSITALNITRIYLIIKVTTAGNQAPHCLNFISPNGITSSQSSSTT